MPFPTAKASFPSIMDPNPHLRWYFQQLSALPAYSPKTHDKALRYLTALAAPGGANKRLTQTWAFSGLSTVLPGLRALIWKVLLGYLTCDPRDWSLILDSKRRLYADLKAVHVAEWPLLIGDLSDHPLSLEPHSRWKSYASDLRLRREILNDVRRTRPEVLREMRLNQCQSSESLVRILFIYARRHPELGYVQGMNDLLAPVFYLFEGDASPGFREEAEADAYFCFEGLMEEMKGMFNRSMDGKPGGIRTQLDHLNALLESHDSQLWNHLERLSVKVQHYGLRWIMLLLTQDFELPQLYRLWDSILADPMRFRYFYYVCLALLVWMREKLLGCDFAQAVALLQKPKIEDLQGLLKLANRLIMSDSSQKGTS